jgi:hypothetical protein
MNQQLYTARILRHEDVESKEKCVQAVAKIICSALNIDSTLIEDIGSNRQTLKHFARSFSRKYALGFEQKVTGNPIFHLTVADLGIPVLISMEWDN